jgi:senataxin
MADAATGGFLQRLVKTILIPTLKIQYRMHPKLCDLVSRLFYEGVLVTPPEVAAERQAQDGVCMRHVPVLGNVEEQSRGGHSFSNSSEAAHVLEIYKSHVASQRGGGCAASSTLVITFYRKQEVLLREEFLRAGFSESKQADRGLRILTVDKSQGSEADTVILSCVRSNRDRNCGFVANPNRVNVAISRARASLWIVGDTDTLSARSPLWRDILAECCRTEVVGALDVD